MFRLSQSVAPSTRTANLADHAIGFACVDDVGLGINVDWVDATNIQSIKRGRQMTQGDIDSLVERLNRGDESAFHDVFHENFARLVRLAQNKLISIPPQLADDEGAVISAFRSFFSGVDKGQFDQLVSRHELWKVLATITGRKAVAQLRRHFKQSGEGNRVDRFAAIELLKNSEPTPDQVAELVDACQYLLDQLTDPTLKRIAVLRLQGYENREIAEMVDLHQRSVQRKLSLIAAEWTLLSEA